MEGGNGASEGCEGGELQIPRGYSLENEIRSICEQWITVLVSTWRLSLASFEKRSGSLNELDTDLSELLSRTETQMEEKHLGVETKLSRMCTTREKGERKSREEKREGLPWWLRGKESACQCKRRGFGSWPKKISHTAEPRHHSYWTVLESPGAAITRPICPRVRTSKQEKPRQWETWAPQPLRILCSPQLEKSPCSHKGSAQPKLNINENLKKEVGGGKHQENSGSQLSDFCTLPKIKQKQQKQELWEMRKAVLNLASY